MKIYLFVFLLLAGAVAIYFLLLSRANTTKTQMKIGSTVISVDIADNIITRAKGLSGSPKLTYDQGMLFIFPNKARQAFWMKDMLFALDFIWINDDRVVQINTDIQPPGMTGGIPVTVTSDTDINNVLEVTSGFIKKYNIKVGDKIKINNIKK